MRAQFIYEKFTEEGDPIRDMGIGIIKKLEKCILPKLFSSSTKKDKEYLKEFFGVSWEKLYYLGSVDDSEYPGDLELIDDKFVPGYEDKIKLFTNKKNKTFNKQYKDEYQSHLEGYVTKYGKIAKLKSVDETLCNAIEIFFIGDLNMAVELEIIKINWKELNYYYA